MTIKTELIKVYIKDIIDNSIQDFEIDENKIAETTAVKMISEIAGVVRNYNKNDFEAMEEIVGIFEKYNISAGGRHDFG